MRSRLFRTYFVSLGQIFSDISGHEKNGFWGSQAILCPFWLLLHTVQVTFDFASEMFFFWWRYFEEDRSLTVSSSSFFFISPPPVQLQPQKVHFSYTQWSSWIINPYPGPKQYSNFPRFLAKLLAWRKSAFLGVWNPRDANFVMLLTRSGETKPEISKPENVGLGRTDPKTLNARKCTKPLRFPWALGQSIGQ